MWTAFTTVLWYISDNSGNSQEFDNQSLYRWGFPGCSVVKNPPANAGDMGLIPGLGRSHGEGNGNPLQYSCPENPVDGEAWWATVHGVAKSQTQLSNLTFTFIIIIHMK